MSSASPDLDPRRASNPLFLPMVIVSSLAVAEAVALVILLVVLLARQGPGPAPAVASSSSPGMAGAAESAASAGAAVPAATGTARPAVAGVGSAAAQAELPHGKRGQRVDSGGFAITLEKIVDNPPSDPLGQVTDQQRYLALLLLVENNTGGNISFYDTAFCLQDDQSFEYKPLAMKLIAPSLQWRNLGHRETIRGYVDFIVPRSSKGLQLIYTHLAQPIHIELDE